jgi:hypothetical protein
MIPPPEVNTSATLRHGDGWRSLWMRMSLKLGDRGSPTRALYYGWVLVGALGITETISWGVLYYAFSVFLTPMEAALGWSRGATTRAFSLALVVSGFAAVPVGRWLVRHGGRLLMSVGSVVGTLLVLAWAGSDNLLLCYLIWPAVGLVMATWRSHPYCSYF